MNKIFTTFCALLFTIFTNATGVYKIDVDETIDYGFGLYGVTIIQLNYEQDKEAIIIEDQYVNNMQNGGYTTIIGNGEKSIEPMHPTDYLSIEIKASKLSKINKNAFKGMTNVTTLTIETATPPSLEEGAFPDALKDITVNVPEESLSEYQEAWGSFFTCLKKEEVNPGTETKVEDTKVNNIKLTGQILVLDNAEYIEIYGITGSNIYKGITNEFELPQKGIYFVKNKNNKVTKFICK